MFAQGGMSPLDVLRAGTINGAHYLGLSHELGSLKKGKKAAHNAISISLIVTAVIVFVKLNMSRTEGKLTLLFLTTSPYVFLYIINFFVFLLNPKPLYKSLVFKTMSFSPPPKRLKRDPCSPPSALTQMSSQDGASPGGKKKHVQ